MNVAIDIDGTITAIPPLFAIMSKALRAEGHKVYIITFRHEDNRYITEAELKDWGIEYDKLVMGDQILRFDWKAKQAVRYKINVFFEDCLEVIEEIKRVKPSCKTFHVRGLF